MTTALEDSLWYYARDRKKIGPLSWMALREAVAQGELTADDMVLREGEGKWSKAASLGELFSSQMETLSYGMPSVEEVNPQHTTPFVGSVSEIVPPGPILSGYEVLGELGRGGMGVVYKARQVALKRIVALKMILESGQARGERLVRFRAEAEAVAKLRHPNIVQVYETGEWKPDGASTPVPYFSLEYVEGGSLDRYLASTPQEPRESAWLVEVLARAMHAAHQAGVVHRDLKPANILLSGEESATEGEKGVRPSLAPRRLSRTIPKITDFGLAKQLDTDSGQTQSGAIMGTPSYMAPEQADGRTHEIGPAADVYALGTILYECLTGRPPFKAPALMATLEQVLHQEPVSPSRLQPKVPRDLETICLKCLEKNAGRRYGSAAELADDLKRFLDNRPILARPVGLPERLLKWAHRQPMVAGLTAAILVLFLISFILVSAMLVRALKAEKDATDASEQAQRDATAARLAESEKGEALEKKTEALKNEMKAREREGDNLFIAHMNLAQRYFDAADLVLARDYLGRHQPRAPGDKDRRGFEWYYYWDQSHNDGEILGGLPGPVRVVAFSPISMTLAIACDRREGGRSKVFLWDAVTRQTPVLLSDEQELVLSLAWSPDGKTLACGTGGEEKAGVIRLWDVTTAKVRTTLKGHHQSVQSLAWAPNGAILASAGIRLKGEGSINAQDAMLLGLPPILKGRTDDVRLWDPKTGRELPLLHGPFGVVLSVGFPPDGRHLFTGLADGSVRIWDLVRRRQVANVAGGGKKRPIWNLTTHPLDRRFLAAGGGESEGECGLFRSSIDGLTVSVSGIVALHMRGIFSAVFSPFGGNFVTGGYDRTIRVWDTSNLEAVGLFKGHAGPVQSLSFAPDGETLASGSWDGTVRLWSMARRQPWMILDNFHAFGRLFFSHDGKVFGIRHRNGRYLLRDTATLRPEGTIEATFVSLQTKDKGQIGRYDRESGTYRIWSNLLGEGKPNLELQVGDVNYLLPAQDLRVVVTAQKKPALIQAWDTVTGKSRSFTKMPQGGIRAIELSPDGSSLAVSSWYNELMLWDVATGQLKGSGIFPEQATFAALSFSPDSKTLASGGSNGQVELWDAADLKPIAGFKGNHQTVWAVSFSPNGKTLASGGRDGFIKLWDVVTGEERLTLQGPAEHVFHLDFSPDEQMLLARYNSEVVLFQAPRKGRSITPPPTELPLVRHRRLAGEAMNRNRYGLAVFHLGKALEQKPDDWQLYRDRGAASLMMEDFRGALADLDRGLVLRPEEVTLVAQRASVYHSLGEWDNVIRESTRAIERGDKSSAPFMLRGRAYDQKGNYNEAVTDLTRAIELKRTSGSVGYRAMAHVGAGDLEKALADFREVRRLNLTSTWGWKGEPLCLLACKDMAAYRQFCSEMLERLIPDSSGETAALLSWVCSLAPDAVKEPDRLVTFARLAVGEPDADRVLGAALLRASKLDEAISQLKKTTESQPNDPVTWLLLSVALGKKGQKAEALIWLGKARDWHEKEHRDKWPMAWDDRLTIQILLAEAEALLKD